MTVFRSSVAKEWQAHRRTLLILFVLLACMAPLLFLFYPAERIGYREFSFRLGIVGMAVVLVTFAPGLLSQERADVLARRLPRSLAATFWARIFLYVAVQGAALLWCLAWGEILRLFVAERFRLEPSRFWLPVASFFFLNVGLGFWVMLVGCWLRSAILALPGAALLLALLILPLYLAHDLSRLLLPSAGESIVLAGLFLITPLLVAFASYVRGLRFVARPRAPAAVGAMALMLLILPLWGWTGVRTWRHLHISPTDPEVAISSVLVGPHARSAYVTLWRPGASGGESPDPWPYALRVNLEDGSWERRGGRGSYWTNVGVADRSSWATGFSGLHRVVCRVVVGGGLRFVDGASGKLLRETPMWHWDPEIASLVRDTKRDVTPWRSSEGRRAWVMGRCWWEDGAGGTAPLEPAFRSGESARWSTLKDVLLIDDHPAPRKIFDPYRGRAFDEPSWRDLRVVAMRRGCWVVRLWLPRGKGGPAATSFNPWRLLDPETGEMSAVRGLEVGDLVMTVLDGGDVLAVRRGGGRQGPLLRIHPETGFTSEVVIEGLDGSPVRGLSDPSTNLSPVRTPDERRVFQVCFGENAERGCFARLEIDGRTLTPALGWDARANAEFSWVLACPDDDTLLVVLERRTIERLRFGSAERELLFPRTSP